jgi:hypothetical protein
MRTNRSWLSGIILSTALFLSGCNLIGTKEPDSQAITSDIQAKLFADPTLKHHDIRVATDNGVVTISGEVSTELEKAAVERIAAQSSGVKKVVNQLTLGAPSAAMTPPPPATTEAAPPPRPKPPRAAMAPSKPPKPVASAPHEPEMVPETPAPPVASGQKAAEPAEAAAPRPPVREPVTVTIPEGTVVMVRMTDGIDSSINKPGEEFAASVSAPVVIGDQIVVRKGADARVRLVNAKTAGKMTGQSELTVELVGLAVGNQTFAVESSSIEKAGASRTRRTAETVGGGAVLGGLLGAIAGRGKGAAIGAAIGAGAGTAVQVMTKGEQVKVPSETQLEFALKGPITVRM